MVKKRTKKGNDVASESLATQDVKAFPTAHGDMHVRMGGAKVTEVCCRQCRQHRWRRRC